MFSLFFDRKHRVLLIRFSGTLRRDVLLAQVEAARRFAALEGPTRLLVDFSSLETLDISVETMKELGGNPQGVPDQFRVYVIPDLHHFGMGRLFGTYQALSGSREPMVVRTTAEAYAVLELTDPDFEPVPL